MIKWIKQLFCKHELQPKFCVMNTLYLECIYCKKQYRAVYNFKNIFLRGRR